MSDPNDIRVHMSQREAGMIGEALWVATRTQRYDSTLWALAFMFQADDAKADALSGEHYASIGEDLRSADAKPSAEHTQREGTEDATSGTVPPGPAPG